MRWSSPQLIHLLWGVLLVALAALYAARTWTRTERSLGESESLRALSEDRGSSIRRWRLIFLLLGLSIACLGLMRPQAGYRLVTTTTRGVDLVLVLDLSRSMDARDVRPDRLAAGKREALSLLEALEGSRTALVGFAGSAQVMSPLSTDREGLESIVETASTRDLDRPGTDVGAALSLAARLLKQTDERPRGVVLISDGENLEGDPRPALDDVRRSGARLYTIGVGTREGTTIPVVDSTGTVRGAKLDAQGGVVITRMNEAILRELAQRGGGRYEHADGTGRAGLGLVDPIRSGGTYELRGRTIRAYNERFPWFAAAAGILLTAERLIPRRRRR